MKATAVRQKASKEIRYESKEDLMKKKHEQVEKAFRKVAPEQLRKFLNREI